MHTVVAAHDALRLQVTTLDHSESVALPARPGQGPAGAQVVQMPALLVIGLWIVLPLFSGIFRSGLLNHSLMCRSLCQTAIAWVRTKSSASSGRRHAAP
jgi:hypothetical protein